MHASVFLQASFPKNALPHFPCPNCGATLGMVDSTYHEGESALSRAAYDAGAIDHTDREGVFSVLLQCVNRGCRENVAMIGQSHVRTERTYGSEEAVDYLTPHAFTPPLRVFPLPKEIPDAIRAALLDSFAALWRDPSAAGNGVRIAVEELLDEVGVRKRASISRKPLKLHQRIELFRVKHQRLGDLLLAVKWLGNAGSHEKALSRKAVLDGYALLEQVLGDLFLKRTQTLDRLARRINKAKGPVP